MVAWATNVKSLCLNPIRSPRNRVSLALALTTNNIAKEDGVEPLGIDIIPPISSILSAGVFSNVSIITLNSFYARFLPNNFTVYTLKAKADNNLKIPAFQKDNGFSSSESAIKTAAETGRKLAILHDKDMLLGTLALGIH